MLFKCIFARPWSAESFEDSINVVSQPSSPLMTTIDSMTSNLAKSLKEFSPTLTPLLSFAGLGYVGYIGSVMFFPNVLSEAGIPLVEDFKFEARSRTTESGFIDSLATGLVKDMIGRTEAADVLKNTTMNALTDGIQRIKRTSKFLNIGLRSTLGALDRVQTALTSECISKYMCQVGQFTSLHIPAIGPLLRSIDYIELDDYSQALVDGTSIGDCNAVFFQCPL